MTASFLSKFKLVDLTHTLNSKVPTWTGQCGYQHKIIVDYAEACRVQSIEMNAGTGTHLDAPSHFIPGGKNAADLRLEDLIVPLVVIDVSKKVHADYYISAEDVLNFEKKFGKIAAGTLVIGHTGWDQYWLDVKKYRNPDDKEQMHFPGFSFEAAQILFDRNVVGLGIDTLSPDCLDLTYPVHHLFLGTGKYLVENLTNCGKLPPLGAFGIMLPIKTEEGTEALIRAVALIPNIVA